MRTLSGRDDTDSLRWRATGTNNREFVTAHEIKLRFPNASPGFIRANLSAAAEISDTESCERPQALAADRGGETPGPGCLHCRFTLMRKKLLDVDAKYASAKDLLDCLETAGIIRGDREGQITLEVRQRKVEKGEQENTVIEVFAASPAGNG